MYISGGRKRVLERFMYELWKRMSFPINDLILEDPVAVSQVGRKGAMKVLERAFSPDLTDCPGVFKDAKTWEPKKTNSYCSMMGGGGEVINPKIYWYLIKLLKLPLHLLL